MQDSSLLSSLLYKAAPEIHLLSIAAQEAFIKSASHAALKKWLDSAPAHPLHLLELARERGRSLPLPPPSETRDRRSFLVFEDAMQKFSRFEDVLQLAAEGKGPNALMAVDHYKSVGVPSVRRAFPGELGFAEGLDYLSTNEIRPLSDSEKEQIFETLRRAYGGRFKFFLTDKRYVVLRVLSFPGVSLRVLKYLPAEHLSSINWVNTPEFREVVFMRLRSLGATPLAWRYWENVFRSFTPGSASSRDIGLFLRNFLLKLTPERLAMFQWWLDPQAFTAEHQRLGTMGPPESKRIVELIANLEKVHQITSSSFGVSQEEKAQWEAKRQSKESMLRARAARVALADSFFIEASAMNVSFCASENELFQALGGQGDFRSLEDFAGPEFFLDWLRSSTSSLKFDDAIHEAACAWVKNRSSVSNSLAAWLTLWYFTHREQDALNKAFLSQSNSPQSVIKRLILNLDSTAGVRYRLHADEVLRKVNLPQFYGAFPFFRELLDAWLVGHPLEAMESSDAILAHWGFLPVASVFKYAAKPTQLFEFMLEVSRGDLSTVSVLLDSFEGTLEEFEVAVGYLGPEEEFEPAL